MSRVPIRWCRCGHRAEDHHLESMDCSRCTCDGFSPAPEPPRSYVTDREPGTGRFLGRRRIA